MSTEKTYSLPGLILTPLRLCMGWLVFSAFWRRIFLQPDDLNPLSPLYEGLKFNHFIPSSLEGIGPMIKFLILHPQLLFIFLWVFTIAEAIIGLALLLGLFTRLTSVFSFSLLLGIMWGAGWLGTTCVDEWQIGVFGTAASLVLFLGGGGPFSLDRWLASSYKSFQRGWLGFLTSGTLRGIYPLTIALSIFALALTLATNQLNAGGVWGPFKNKAPHPHLTLSALSLNTKGELKMDIYRDAGPDTYGSFAVSVRVVNGQGKTVLDFDSTFLGTLSVDQIHNHYLVKVQPNGRSLVVPLGALATIELTSPRSLHLSPGYYFVEVTDIDGSTWKAPVAVP